ncbi:MAG: UvrD-helicase domain-containing protein [Elusimicrobia bacterium]|nr:UvrD-helicase domain-containing protein [Elusimicrobiota bacterium]MBU2614185.1 UvrD-helicase domain-containing protein [Elusimicrobiota bacterium]
MNPNIMQFPEVRVLEASAGSGKTYALAKRYIQLLLNPDIKLDDIPIRSILAITFTNKATFEMKQRIIELLKKIALDDFKSEGEARDIYSSLNIDKETAKKKAYTIINDYIIKNYNFFQVQTIDSFVRSIISGSAFKLNLSSGFQIEKDYDSYIQYSLDRFVDKAGEDKAIKEVFRKFLKQYLIVEEKSSWFPKDDIYEIVKFLYSINNKYGASFARTKIESADITPKKKTIIKLVNELHKKVKDTKGADKRFCTSLEKFVEENKEYFDVSNISRYFFRAEVPFTKGNVPGESIVKTWDSLHKSFVELAEMEAYSIYNYYIDIFSLVLKDFKTVSKNDDVVFLEELNNQARFLFDEKYISVPEIYFRLASRFRHLLIDEFQDTSRLQWKNLSAMAEEILSNGGSLFYVGDKKQAIYRFRGGDVSLFNEVAERFNIFNLNKGTLLKNYRSQKAIVEFNNIIFSQENIEGFIQGLKENEKDDIEKFKDSDLVDIFNVFSDSKQEYKQGNENGYVRVEQVPGGNDNETAQKPVTGLIQELKNRQYAYGDLAILVRKNSDVETYTSLLLEVNIPVESEKTLNIRENYLIKELISFLKFLKSPSDNLFFASFLLGDIFLKSSGLRKYDIQDFLFSVRTSKSKDKITYLYKEFQGKYNKVWDELISEFFKNAGLVPLYEFVISIYSKFSVLDNFSEYQGFLMKFLELIKSYEEESSSVSDFLEYFDGLTEEKDLYVNVTKGDSVKILTIHKAKGLEFPVVIIPGLSLSVKIDPQIIDAKKEKLNLLYIKQAHTEFSPKLNEIYIEEYKKAFIDELNSVYVALTRAQQELYIFIPEKVSGKKNKVKYLFSFEEPNFEKGSPARAVEEVKYEQKKDANKEAANKEAIVETMPVSRYSDWIELIKDEFVEVSQVTNRENIERGEVLHSVLSFIENIKGQNLEEVIKNALEKTKMRHPVIDNLREIGQKVKKLLENEKFKDYFNLKEGNVFVEKEIIDASGRTRRIDRLVVLEKRVYSIDYKSSESPETTEIYKQQMEEYIRLIKEIYPNKKVEGIIIYLDTLKSKEIEIQNE